MDSISKRIKEFRWAGKPVEPTADPGPNRRARFFGGGENKPKIGNKFPRPNAERLPNLAEPGVRASGAALCPPPKRTNV